MALSTVPVLVRHNFEYFDFCVDILDQYSLTRNTSILKFFFLGKLAPFRFLFRRFTILVDFNDSLITAVHLLFYAIKNTSADCVFVQLEIMCLAEIFRNANDFFCAFVDNNLSFYGVLFLFPRIPAPLFFLGRSTGHSVTSTRTISMLSSASNAFFPGNLNFSSLTRVFSTQTIVS